MQSYLLDLRFCFKVKIQFVKNSIEVRYAKFPTELVHSKHSCVAQSCTGRESPSRNMASKPTISRQLCALPIASWHDKRHPREDFVEFVIFHGRTLTSLFSPVFTRFCAFATGYVAAALAPVIWTPIPIVPPREYLESEISSKSRNPIAKRKSISCNERIIRCEPKIYLWRTSASQKKFSPSLFSINMVFNTK